MIQPRTIQDVFTSMRSSLSNKIAKLTNFTPNSFNFVWTRAFSSEIRELEVQALASQLSGFIDYAGGPITDEDISRLGLQDSVTAEELNEYMVDSDLDQLVSILGVSRLSGSRATGEVDITTESGETTIPEGTVVTTEPDSAGNVTAFRTTETASTSSGATIVTNVEIQALEAGEEFNIPAGQINSVRNPPIGLVAVTNPSATEGGTSEESNQSLRQRAKEAVEWSSEGGTVSGITSFIERTVEGVDSGDVFLDEFTEQQPPFVDVVVSGGLEEELLPAIEASRPAGITHNLARPQNIVLGADANVVTGELTDAQKQQLQTEALEITETFLNNLDIGEDMVLDSLSLAVANGISFGNNIFDIDRLSLYYERSVNEEFEYDTSRVDAEQAYRLDFTYDNVNGISAVRDSAGNDFTENVDYQIINTTPDGIPDTIQWIPQAGTTPEDRRDSSAFPDVVDTRFFVDYDISVADETKPQNRYTINTERDQTFTFLPSRVDTFTFEANDTVYNTSNVPFEDDIRVSQAYRQGEDFNLVDSNGDGILDAIEWDALSSSPDDGTVFSVVYDGFSETFTFDDQQSVYVLSNPVISEFVFIQDETQEEYQKYIDWQLAPLQEFAQEDVFTFNSSQPNYTLTKDVDVDFVTVQDENNVLYVRGEDYVTTDNDGDGFDDTITWGVSVAGAVSDDGGSTTDETTEANDTTDDNITLLPSTPEEDDAYYIGSEQEFYDIDIDVTTAGDGDWTIVWEYYDGSSWSSLSNVSDGTGGFESAGENTVSWNPPEDWSVEDVGSITDLYWVRARVDSFTSVTTQPLAGSISLSTTPPEGTEFTVFYDAFPQSIIFDDNENIPNAGFDVSVLYKQQVYPAGQTLALVPSRVIVSDVTGSQTQHTLGTDFEVVDIDNDQKNDAIRWLDTPTSTIPSGSVDFHVSYVTDPNVEVGTREKVEAGTVTIDIQ